MALVVVPVKLPAVLNGQSNGKLPTSILVSTPGLGGGPTVRLVEPAARCWRAFSGTAPMVLKATSSADSYRTLAQQLATWHARYEPDPFPGYIGTRWWPAHYDEQGRWVNAHLWYQLPNTAVAAVPGTSNHGLALAVDVANASGSRLAWMQANVRTFGFSFETQSEPWHVRATEGDDIPDAVLAYEQGVNDMTPEQAASLDRIGWRVVTMLYDAPTTMGGDQAGERNQLHERLVRIEAKTDAALAAIGEIGSSSPEVAVILAALAEQQAELEAAITAAGEEARDAVGDLAEGGAAQVRADA